MQVLPENDFGDHLYSFISFIRMHRRLPSDKLLFNDVLYKIKTTKEISNPLRVFVSDKVFVKLFVKAVVGDQFNVPTINVLHTIEEVRDYVFPADCCIKPTHLSGEVILRKQNKPIDFEKISRWFKTSYYSKNREANYKTLSPKVIVEPLVFNTDNLYDYKILCYMGKPKLIQVSMDRHTGNTEKMLDIEWNELPFSMHYPWSRNQVSKPKNLDKMLEVARLLSQNFTLIRVDMYSNGEECLVGEITNCPGGATGFVPNLYGKKSNASDSTQKTTSVDLKTGEVIVSNIIFGKD